MKHQIFSTALVEEAARKMKVANLQEATIGEVLLVASRLAGLTGQSHRHRSRKSCSRPRRRGNLSGCCRRTRTERGGVAICKGIYKYRHIPPLLHTDNRVGRLVFRLLHRLYSTQPAERYRFIYRPGIPHTEIAVAYLRSEVGTIRHLSFQGKQLAGQVGIVSRKRPYRCHYLFQSQ